MNGTTEPCIGKLLCLLFLTILLLTAFTAEAKASELLSLESKQVEIGDEFRISVLASGFEKPEGLHLDITYNTSILEVTGVSKNSTAPDAFFISNIDDPGRISIASMYLSPVNIQTITPITDIHFKAIDSGTSELIFEKTEASEGDSLYIPNHTNGQVKVNDSPHVSQPVGYIVDKLDPEHEKSGVVSSGGTYQIGSKVPVVIYVEEQGRFDSFKIFVNDTDNDNIGVYNLQGTGNTTVNLFVDIPEGTSPGDCYIYEENGKLEPDHFQIGDDVPEFVNTCIPLLFSVFGFVFMRKRIEKKCL